MFVTCLRRYHSFKLSFFLSESNPCIYKDRNYRENVLTCRCCCYCYHWRQEQEESHNFSGRLSRKNIWNRYTVIQSVFVSFRTSECHRTDDKKHYQASQFSELLHWRAIRLSCRMSKLLMSRGIKDMNTSQTKFHLLCLTKVTSALNGWGWTRFLHLKRL